MITAILTVKNPFSTGDFVFVRNDLSSDDLVSILSHFVEKQDESDEEDHSMSYGGTTVEEIPWDLLPYDLKFKS